METRLVTQEVCDHLRGQFEALPTFDQTDLSMLVDWLCQQKAISRFQADIFSSGLDAPFRFGNYLVLKPIWLTAQGHLYAGRHTLTGHQVLIEFFAGDQPRDLEIWRMAKQFVPSFRSNPHPNLCRIYEAVAIPEYRFIVSEFPRGKNLESLLPESTRVNWKKATDIVSQIVGGFIHCHEQGLFCDRFEPKLIWLSTNLVQTPVLVRNGLSHDPNHESERDLWVSELGAFWLRLIAGREATLETLSNHKVPARVFEIIQETFSDECDQQQLLKKVLKLGEKVRQDDNPAKLVPRKTQSAYFAWLRSTPEAIFADGSKQVELSAWPVLDQQVQESISKPGTVNVTGTDSELMPTAKRHSVSLMPIVGSLFLVGLFAVAVVVLTINQPNSTAKRDGPNAVNVLPETDPEIVGASLQPEPRKESGGDFLVDDGVSLWEQATSGQPVDFTGVPYSPALAFHVRWAELAANPAGQKTLLALGPELNQQIQSWQTSLGVPAEQIKSVLVSLHTSDEFRYQPFSMVQLLTPIAIDDLIAAWGAKSVQAVSEDGEEITYYRSPENQCYFAALMEGQVTQFAMASEQLILECIELQGINVVSGSMKRLVQSSDQDQLFNMLFVTPGLFNDEGQKLMAGSLLELNRQLSVALDRNIRGALLGVHLDDDVYVELRLDSTIDLKPDAAEEHLKQLIDDSIDFVKRETESGTADGYWQPVSARYPNMLKRLKSAFRFGEEDRNLIANGWLPAVSIHNLVAASELFLALGVNKSTEVKDRVVPASIEELLTMPRDLSVSTSPDLIVLLNNLQQEIRDDFGGLPFEFEIRLNGADLEKEGITQNQRPSDIEMRQQPLSKILTEIMVKANPDKNISGSSDPNCKMVWVLIADPDNLDRKIIMITTRSAARDKRYPLPQEFR